MVIISKLSDLPNNIQTRTNTFMQIQYNAHMEIQKNILNGRHIQEALKKVPLQEIGFRFLDITTYMQDKKEYNIQSNYSGWIYPDGIVLNSKDVKAKDSLCAYWDVSDKIVITRTGIKLPFYPNDKVIPVKIAYVEFYNGFYRWK